MFERYLKIPYKDGGRDWTGCDCWGLVRLILAEERGILLPAFDSVCDLSSFMSVRSMFTRVDSPSDWDLVNLRARGPFFAHVGLYHRGLVIQAYVTGVAVQPLGRVERMVEGFYSPCIRDRDGVVACTHESPSPEEHIR